MPVSRRSLLRSLGALSAASLPLPFANSAPTTANAEIGYPAASTSSQILILFEGPWIFSGEGGNFNATTFGIPTDPNDPDYSIASKHNANIAFWDSANHKKVSPVDGSANLGRVHTMA